MRIVPSLLLLAGFAFALAGCEAGKTDVDTVAEDNVAGVSGFTSSGQPNEAELATLAEEGYVAVIDLRGEAEDRGFDEAAAAGAVGLEYISLPVPNADAVNPDNALKLGELLDQYDEPVLVHCGSGNRVGALVALLEAERGASTDEALEAGKAAGLTRLEGLVRERLEVSAGK